MLPPSPARPQACHARRALTLRGGRPRAQVFRHRHEIESGRTSSISQQIMGLDSAGNLVQSSNGLRDMDWAEIVAASSKARSRPRSGGEHGDVDAGGKRGRRGLGLGLRV